MSLATGVNVAYLAAAVFFILALKGLTFPKFARRGNIIGVVGMLIAVVMTFVAVHGHIKNAALIALAILIGVAIGFPSARLVKMTAMPQMVAAFNGVGGGTAALVDLADFMKGSNDHVAEWIHVAVVFGVIVGCISFSGSIIAFLKLQEVMRGTPITYKGQQPVNALVGIGILALAGTVLATTSSPVLGIMGVLALVFGVAFVLPIGGADMPIVISLLNSFTGLAVAASGFVLSNVLLIVAGTLVGSSGTILTRMMSQAMGRSLTGTLSGRSELWLKGLPAWQGPKLGLCDLPEQMTLGLCLTYANKVIIVPGYGLAVAQAQHTVRELASLLEERGVEVTYAIHPVAGRMPGHMNVLLAEADVPYEQLKEMDEINPEFASTDVALVVGANDVVNPAARDSPGSPIYGMPILDVDKAVNVVFMKRSMRPGFAGIDNELFYDPKTTLLFGDAKDSLSKLVAAVKSA